MDHGTYDEHQAYCESMSGAEPELLHELRRATHLRCIHPRMASGPFLGRVLSMLSKMTRPDRILEIGTYTGYSALCLAEGLSADGELITIEKNDELEAIQSEFIAKSAYSSRIITRIGDAIDVLPTLEGPFQIIFLDADKENYLNYLPHILQLAEQGTLILIDNMLWEGKVMFDEFTDEQTAAIRQTTEKILAHPMLDQILLPIRDGLLVARVNRLEKPKNRP